MYSVNIARAIQMISVNKIRDFIFEIFYKRIVFSKDISYYSMKLVKIKDVLLLTNKLTGKVPDRRNTK